VPVVQTGALTSPVPGLWRRLSLISSDGSITGLSDAQLVGQLEELGIPRHQLGIAHLLQSWQRARIPPVVAFALWQLRDRVDERGCIYRRPSIPVEESSPAIRYIQLAAELGETRRSDPTLHRVVDWLLDRQLADGSIPLIVSAGYGETGQTSRTLRALGLLLDPELSARLDAMREYLVGTAISQPVGAAWTYSTIDRTVVTGSTSHVVTCLVGAGGPAEVIAQGVRFLLAVQEPNGGWAEVPGYQPAVHNCFNVVRALRTAQRAGIADADEVTAALDRARHWFRYALRGIPSRTVIDQAFAVRTAMQLDLLHLPRYERLTHRLSRRQRQFLAPTADAYAETEIAAIALAETSRHVDAAPEDHPGWRWRWRLPAVSPPFLARGTYFYDLLYSAVNARWWVRVVDALMDRDVVDRTAGLVLGTITALAVINPDVADVLVQVEGARLTVTLVGIAVLLLLWFGVKIAAQTSLLKALSSSVGALVPAAVLTWVLDSPTPDAPALMSLLGLRLLVIDVVAFTADSTGLLDRLLPKQ